MKRALLALAAALLAACGQPQAPAPEARAAEVDAAARDAVLAVLNPAMTADIGKPVVIEPTTLKTEGDWAWVIGQPKTPKGDAFSFEGTTYADAAAEGFIDGGGTTYALLKRNAGVWTVTAFAVGPTDVAWLTWPQEYGAPASLLGVPTEPATDDVHSGPVN